jgi:hypothetical protein
MTWQHRVRELICAGGTLALSACFTSGGPACGNANPDPCVVCECGRSSCTKPIATECDDKAQCADTNGVWSDPELDYAYGTSDAGAPVCVRDLDGGFRGDIL